MSGVENLKRIRAALPKGGLFLIRACERCGYVAREVLQNPSDEQTDNIIAALLEMTVEGTVSETRARNREIARQPDPHGDGGRYVRGHTWGDELGTEGHVSDSDREI